MKRSVVLVRQPHVGVDVPRDEVAVADGADRRAVGEEHGHAGLRGDPVELEEQLPDLVLDGGDAGLVDGAARRGHETATRRAWT